MIDCIIMQIQKEICETVRLLDLSDDLSRMSGAPFVKAVKLRLKATG